MAGVTAVALIAGMNSPGKLADGGTPGLPRTVNADSADGCTPGISKQYVEILRKATRC